MSRDHKPKMHVLHTFANNDHVPYLTWFADKALAQGYPKYTFAIMYPERPKIIEEMRAKGFNVEWIPYRDTHRRSDMVKALLKLWTLMRKYRPDIVHCNLFDDSLPGMIAAKLAGIRIRVITKQDTGYHFLHAPKWIFADRINSRFATDIIAISEESRDYLISQEKAPKNKITLVHNGIPPELFTQQDPVVMARLRDRFGIKGKNPIFGTVARFIEWKGYRHIIDAAKEIVVEYPNAIFLLCGSGEQRPVIEKLVLAAGLSDHIVFTGWIQRNEMASFYGLLDVYLHAAILEPFGLVYPEAMMNNVPIVSTATGAAKDAITNGYNGILVSKRNGLSLANGVRELFRADHKLMGKTGGETAKRMYSFETMWKGTIDLYSRALER